MRLQKTHIDYIEAEIYDGSIDSIQRIAELVGQFGHQVQIDADDVKAKRIRYGRPGQQPRVHLRIGQVVYTNGSTLSSAASMSDVENKGWTQCES